MTDETRILRTVGIPIVIAIVLLVVMPKMCVKAVVVAKARQEKAARESGLHIESTHAPVVVSRRTGCRARSLSARDRQPLFDAVHGAPRQVRGDRR